LGKGAWDDSLEDECLCPYMVCSNSCCDQRRLSPMSFYLLKMDDFTTKSSLKKIGQTFLEHN